MINPCQITWSRCAHSPIVSLLCLEKIKRATRVIFNDFISTWHNRKSCHFSRKIYKDHSKVSLEKLWRRDIKEPIKALFRVDWIKVDVHRFRSLILSKTKFGWNSVGLYFYSATFRLANVKTRTIWSLLFCTKYTIKVDVRNVCRLRSLFCENFVDL